MGVDLAAFAARLHAAREESGTWALQEEDGGVWIDALGDGPEPGDAACRFLREIREDTEDLVAELRAGREFRDDIHRALQSGRWRGWDGPDGVSKDEVIADVAAALEWYDQATGRPGPAAGHAEPEGPP